MAQRSTSSGRTSGCGPSCVRRRGAARLARPPRRRGRRRAPAPRARPARRRAEPLRRRRAAASPRPARGASGQRAGARCSRPRSASSTPASRSCASWPAASTRPMLTQRGLEPALQSLASRAPLPVDVSATLDERLPTAVETAAYFAVSEALANVVKHAGAGLVAVDVRHRVRPADDRRHRRRLRGRVRGRRLRAARARRPRRRARRARRDRQPARRRHAPARRDPAPCPGLRCRRPAGDSCAEA